MQGGYAESLGSHPDSGGAPWILAENAEEYANAVTHGIGLVLSIAGAIVLVAHATSQGDAWHAVGCSVFAATLIAVYAASTLSHSPSSPHQRRLFRTLDQGAIYLLIAGTYTPFALAYLRTGWWLSFLALMWAVALGGFLSKVLYSHRVDAVAVWTYVLLGWMPVISIFSLVELVSAVAMAWILTGGMCYTIGTLFLIYDRERPHFHAVWHTLVIAGSTCHYLAIFFFVA
jgi:hemolysin III